MPLHIHRVVQLHCTYAQYELGGQPTWNGGGRTWGRALASVACIATSIWFWIAAERADGAAEVAGSVDATVVVVPLDVGTVDDDDMTWNRIADYLRAEMTR